MIHKLSLVIFFALCSLGAALGLWEIDVTDLKKDGAGNFEISYLRQDVNGENETLVLHDNDGIATLATTQLMLMSKLPQNESAIDTPLSELLPKGGTRILSVQHDALEKLLASLKKAASDLGGDPNALGLTGTNLKMKEAIQLTEDLLARFSAKKLWTLRDIWERGNAIRRFVGGGGPYSTTNTKGGEQTTSSILLSNRANPENSFLSGWIQRGLFSPPFGISKSHVFITGDLAQLAQTYEAAPGEGTKSFSAQRTIAHQ